MPVTHSRGLHTLHDPSPVGPLAAKVVVGILVAIGVAVVAGAALLWPRQEKVDIPLPFQNAAGAAVTTEAGQVLSTGKAACGGLDVGAVITRTEPSAGAKDAPCVHALVTIESGPNADAMTVLEFSSGPGQPVLAPGDDIRVSRQVDQSGTTTYAFYDYERTWPLVALGVAFAVVIVAVARWRGLRALAGIVVALLLAAVLSWGAIDLAHLTGLSDDQNNEVAAYLGDVSISGLLLAGFIIGSLGVLNDVTVTQASTVFELAEVIRAALVAGSSRAPCASAATTSPARSTRWCWHMPASRSRCRCR